MVLGNKEKKQAQLQRQADHHRRVAAAQAEREAEAQDRLQKAREERDIAVMTFKAEFLSRVDETVRSGATAHLYWETYVPVDAQMNRFGPAAGLDLQTVNDWGRRGWEVQGVIPRTYGGFQTYKVDKTASFGTFNPGQDTHQVGLGGHIVGVYALLHYAVTAENFDKAAEAIDFVATKNLPENLRRPI